MVNDVASINIDAKLVRNGSARVGGGQDAESSTKVGARPSHTNQTHTYVQFPSYIIE